jgi:hypothetical protein
MSDHVRTPATFLHAAQVWALPFFFGHSIRHLSERVICHIFCIFLKFDCLKEICQFARESLSIHNIINQGHCHRSDSERLRGISGALGWKIQRALLSKSVVNLVADS